MGTRITRRSDQQLDQNSGPGNVVFDDPTALVTNAQFDTPGTYVVRLVTGGGQQIASDDVVINVENSGFSNSPVCIKGLRNRRGNACVTIWGNPDLERFQRNPYGKYQIRAYIACVCR